MWGTSLNTQSTVTKRKPPSGGIIKVTVLNYIHSKRYILENKRKSHYNSNILENTAIHAT